MKSTLYIIISIYYLTYAARPLKTNDAYTIGKSRFQLEISSDITNEYDGKQFSLPAVLTLGISNETDLFVCTSVGHGAGSNNFLSFECIDLGFKQNILSLEKYNLSIATGLSSLINENGLNSPAAFFNLINSVRIENLSLHHNLGYNQNFNDEEFKDIWFSSVGCEYRLEEKIILAADLGIGRDPSIHRSTIQSYAMIGVSYSLISNITIDTGLSYTFQKSVRFELLTTGVTLSL